MQLKNYFKDSQFNLKMYISVSSLETGTAHVKLERECLECAHI